ncbi:MAG: HD domain-containing protein [Clostridia bacterium]|nr:HD domain-containing protein [Clostridia bacterium]
MKIAMDKLCIMFSKAFDVIEKEQLGASENHSMRVAVICCAMGKQLGYDDETISAIATCGLFHDSALTEYHLSQKPGAQQERNMVLHNEKGQENVSWLPFKINIDKFVLYHHERGDGNGPFHKSENEIPLESALIAAADAVDATYHLQRVPAGELSALRDQIVSGAEMYSTRVAVEALLEILDEDFLATLRDENIAQTIERVLPRWDVDIADPRVVRIGEFIARVIDYKSVFTHMHTSQIANRAWVMAEHYGYEPGEKNALFLAASLHDIGKIAVPTEILEKPGKLDDEEFTIIKQHVQKTLEWLREIPDFEQIRNWAADHHEKLIGLGYARGKAEDALDFNARLMACIDIYQAVIEPRPYHDARTHQETMQILYDMSSKGLIDAGIVKDLDGVMAEYSLRPVPSPNGGAGDKGSETQGHGADRASAPLNGYRCNVCGYFYEGDHLPENFICPVCRNQAANFMKSEGPQGQD